MKIKDLGLALGLAVVAARLAAIETGVTDKEILLGQSAAFSGPAKALGTELWRGAQAAFSEANGAGGVHGRQVRVVAYDDGYDGARTLTNTVKLIEGDKVFALFGYVGTPTLVAALPTLLKAQPSGLFLFSDFTGAQVQREEPFKNVVFNVRASYRQETQALVDAFAGDLALKKIGVFFQNDPYGQSGLDGVKRALLAKHLAVVASASYERNLPYETSMASQVKVLKAANADAIVMVGAYTQCAAFIRDLRAAGYQGWVANLSFVGADALLRLLKKEGGDLTAKLVNSQVVPNWADSTIPLVAQYAAAMDKAQPHLPAELLDPSYEAQKRSFVSFEGYINARLFLKIANAVKGDLTRAGFTQAAMTTPVDLGGFKLAFDPAKRQASNKVFFTVVKDGVWKTVPNLKGQL